MAEFTISYLQANCRSSTPHFAQRKGLCAVAAFGVPSSAELKLTIVNNLDVYYCCSTALCQPKLLLNSQQKADAAFCLPLLHKTPCCTPARKYSNYFMNLLLLLFP
jgi:hypothetical protein